MANEARHHAVELRQCAIFAADLSEHIAKAMTDAADFLDQLATRPSINRQQHALQVAADANGGYIDPRITRIVKAALDAFSVCEPKMAVEGERGDWCGSNGFLDRHGKCRNPDGCTCDVILSFIDVNRPTKGVK